MDEGTSIQLCGSVCDPDGNLVSYLWGADKGTFDDAASLNPVYFAPMTDACNGEDVCITLTAVDRCGARGCDRLTLHINNVNHAPIAHAGEDFCVSACTAVQLTGATAADPDGDQLSYAWTVANGRGVFDDPHVLRPAFSVPSTPACGGEDLVLTLTVTDACGAVSTDSLTIHVSPLGISSPQW